jgi:hypothetical protein
MSTRFGPSSLAVLVAVVALLFLQPGKAQAHPQLTGRWFATAPPNVNMSFDFAPGQYIGDGIWRGTFTLYWANQFVSCGDYELRVLNGNWATLGLRDGSLANQRMGEVDLGNKVMTIKGATYRP